MTMLDRMRRHKSWLKWSLALVVLTFVIFYIPDFMRGKGAATGLPSDEIAQVNGRGISVLEFRQAYQRQVAAYRSAYGANISEQLLKQLGFEQQVLQQLVNEQAMVAEAERWLAPILNYDPRSLARDVAAFGTPFPGQAVENLWLRRNEDIFAWADRPTAAAYLARGAAALLRIDVDQHGLRERDQRRPEHHQPDIAAVDRAKIRIAE